MLNQFADISKMQLSVNKVGFGNIFVEKILEDIHHISLVDILCQFNFRNQEKQTC